MRRRHRIAALFLSAGLVASSAALAAGAGSASDPLISLNWLRNTFIPKTLSQAEERINQRAEGGLDSTPSAAAGTGTELRVKRGDVLTVETGGGIVPLAGDLTGSSLGTVVDTTEGIVLPSGTALQRDHRYIVAEQTIGSFTVASDTAVVRFTGNFRLTSSSEVDYNALADALNAMRLFRGTDTPYGSGYDLEEVPTRAHGLVLFLRLLGEEEAALGYSSSVAFSDVPDWALPYVAYAYDKGYTKGAGSDAQGRMNFNTDAAITDNEYMTFLLRALNYEEGVDFNWTSATQDAVPLSVLTSGEEALLSSKPFLRAQIAYLSYYALFAPVKGEGRVLLDRLAASGAVDRTAANAAIAAVTGTRL